MTQTLAPAPLSRLSEEEALFRATVREFAETEIKPYVHEMDEAAKFRPELIAKFFELGLMGIEVPERHGAAATPLRWRPGPTTAAPTGSSPAGSSGSPTAVRRGCS